MIDSNMTIEGQQEAQAALNKIVVEMQPNSTLGKAVQFVTVGAQGYAVRIVHVDTGAYRASIHSRLQLAGEPRGTVYVDASARNPKTGQRVTSYAIVEERRGGSHATFQRTVDEAGPKLLEQAGRMLLEAMPRGN